MTYSSCHRCGRTQSLKSSVLLELIPPGSSLREAGFMPLPGFDPSDTWHSWVGGHHSAFTQPSSQVSVSVCPPLLSTLRLCLFLFLLHWASITSMVSSWQRAGATLGCGVWASCEVWALEWGLTSCGVPNSVMWDLLDQGSNPVSPALAGKILTTDHQGKSLFYSYMTTVTGFRYSSTVIQGDLQDPCLRHLRDPFPHRLHSQILGIRTWMYLF